MLRYYFKQIIFLTIFECFILSGFSQEKISRYAIGINAAELPALTLDINHYYKLSKRLSLTGNTGISFNHTYGGDLNWFLVPHYKCENDGYKIINQSGGFIKAGMRFNFKKERKQKKYLFMVFNAVNSIVYEKAYITSLTFDTNKSISHWKDIFGAGTTIGYSFKISKRLLSDVGLQISYPFYKENTLYGYQDFIPGIGFKDSDSMWFPVIVFNITYPFSMASETSDF